jgi:hypothetical protein
MDIYAIIAKWTGWHVVAALLIVGGSYGYWLLKSQIDLLKSENEFLKSKLSDSLNFTSDVLSQRLAERVKLLSEELEQLQIDNQVSKDMVIKKEKELLQAITKSIDHALIRLRFATSETVNLLAIAPNDNPLIKRSLAEIKDTILLAVDDLRFSLVNDSARKK